MIFTTHLHHFASFSLEHVQELVAPLLVPNSNLVEHKATATPAAAGAIGAEHGVRTENVEIGGKHVEQELFGKLLDRKDVDEQCARLQTLQRKSEEHVPGGKDGATEQNDFGAFVAEVVGFFEERYAEFECDVGVVGAGMGQDGVALSNQGSGQELPKFAEAYDANL